MDLLKTLLVYMMMVMTSAADANPDVTPPPATPTPEPTPYVSPAPTEVPLVYATLQKGSMGDDVRTLQTLLKQLGYLSGSVDGDFGNQTRKAVEAFQQDKGLKADGIVGNATWAMLYAATATATPAPTNTPAPTIVPTTTPTVQAVQTTAPQAPLLSKYGDTLALNGSDVMIPWYRNEEKIVMVELQALAEASIPYSAKEGLFSATINGQEVNITYTATAVTDILVNGISRVPEEGTPVVWEGKLYVPDTFLTQLGVTCTDGGDILAIDHFAQ